HLSAAERWWLFFRETRPGDHHATTLKRLRDFFEAGKAGKDFEDLLREAERRLPAERADRARGLQDLAETCRAVGREGLARACWEKAAAASEGPEAFLRLGDLHAARKEWPRAAARYAEAWEKDRQQPLPLYLRGWALAE